MSLIKSGSTFLVYTLFHSHARLVHTTLLKPNLTDASNVNSTAPTWEQVSPSLMQKNKIRRDRGKRQNTVITPPIFIIKLSLCTSKNILKLFLSKLPYCMGLLRPFLSVYDLPSHTVTMGSSNLTIPPYSNPSVVWAIGHPH